MLVGRLVEQSRVSYSQEGTMQATSNERVSCFLSNLLPLVRTKNDYYCTFFKFKRNANMEPNETL